MKKGQMKFSGMMMMVVMVMAFFVGASIIVNDFQKAYVDTNITSPEGDFHDEDLLKHTPDVEEVDDKLSPLRDSFDKIANEEGFLRLQGVLEVFPVMLITGIQLMPTFLSYIQDSLTSLFQTIIPGTAEADSKEAGTGGILVLASLALIIWLFFKAVEALRRYPT